MSEKQSFSEHPKKSKISKTIKKKKIKVTSKR